MNNDTPMAINSRVILSVYRAIDDINMLLPRDERLEKSRAVTLYGRTTKLDSLGLVNLIVAIEKRVEEEFEFAVCLIGGKNIDTSKDSFKTIGTLADHIVRLLEERVRE